jgi:hypothetical protein
MRFHNQWAVRILVVFAIVPSTASFILAGPLSKSDPSPVVVRAAVDRLEPDRLVIRGNNFGTTTAPVVMLTNTTLQVLSFNDEEIVARLPLDIPAARYRLQVLVDGDASSPLVDVMVGRRAGRRSEG